MSYRTKWLIIVGHLHSSHDKLPFGCNLAFADSQEEVINDYLKSTYLNGVIPWDEFRDLDLTEESLQSNTSDNDISNDFVLKVFSELIRKDRSPELPPC